MVEPYYHYQSFLEFNLSFMAMIYSKTIEHKGYNIRIYVRLDVMSILLPNEKTHYLSVSLDGLDNQLLGQLIDEMKVPEIILEKVVIEAERASKDYIDQITNEKGTNAMIALEGLGFERAESTSTEFIDLLTLLNTRKLGGDSES